MASIPATIPALPPDVIAFAAEHELTDYLPAVLALTRRAFPASSISPLLEADAEAADDTVIVMEVDVAGLDVSQLVAAQHKWSQELFSCCPSTHAHLFCLRPV